MPLSVNINNALTLGKPSSGGGGGGFNPVVTALQLNTLAGLAQSGASPSFTYSGDGLGTGSTVSIAAAQEASVECVIPAGGVTAFLMLVTVNNIAGPTDATVAYGIQFNNTTFKVIVAGAVGTGPNTVGQTIVPTAGDTLKLACVGVGATSVCQAIVIRGGKPYVIFQFAAARTQANLYPALQSFGAATFSGLTLRVGQAQARWPYSAINAVTAGDSIMDNMKLWIPNYAPLVGTGTVLTSTAVAGYRFADMTANIATTKAAYNGGKTNELFINGGSNDCFLDAASAATMLVSLATFTAAARSGGFTWKIYFNSILPRAGGMGGVQATIDARNAIAQAFNATVKASPATYGVDVYIEQQVAPYNLTQFTQTQFDAINAIYPWQEPVFANEVHPDILGQDQMSQVQSTGIGTTAP